MLTVNARKRSKLQILFADESIVVVDKPSGMVVDDVAKETGAILVHRLDKDTSGVMILAKNASAELSLKKQFEERKVTKKYLALVHGEMKEEQGLITTALQRYPKDKLRSAITEWKVVPPPFIPPPKLGGGQGEVFTLLELMPHTGRTHQLRKHLKSIGHPIVSDPIYGFRKKIKDDLKWCPRLFLHAKYLEFTHPVSGKSVHFESGLPSELENVLNTTPFYSPS